MAGIVVGSVDHKVGNTGDSANNNQELFTVVYNFLNSKYTRIAANFGTGGTGFDFWDGADPSGENAFAVFRTGSAAVPFDVMIQWADTENWGKMKLLSSTILDGVGIVAAMREDGTDPFNGGPVLLGSDTNASVDTSSNFVLRIRPNQVDPYTAMAVTSGAATAKTTIRNDLNAAFTLNGLPFVAAVEGTNQLKIYALELSDVDIDTFANGSTLNTPLGLTDGATVDPNLGADEVPPNGVAPAWSDGSSTLHMLDYANGDNGSHGNGTISTDRNNMYRIGYDYGNPTTSWGRIHCIADNDGLFIAYTAPTPPTRPSTSERTPRGQGPRLRTACAPSTTPTTWGSGSRCWDCTGPPLGTAQARAGSSGTCRPTTPGSSTWTRSPRIS
jgi:hypothetical protein